MHGFEETNSAFPVFGNYGNRPQPGEKPLKDKESEQKNRKSNREGKK